MLTKYIENSGWEIIAYDEEDLSFLEALISDMYQNEKKEGNLSEKEYIMRVKETTTSIVCNFIESAYIEEMNGTAYFVVSPEFGLGVVEIPIKHVDISLV